MPEHWNNEYYDNLEFYYYEPDHLRKKTDPNLDTQSVQDVVKRLRRIEVSLNHQMNLFFQLAPIIFKNDFFQRCFGVNIDDDWKLVGREIDKLWKINGITQPDLFFNGRTTNVAVELKLSSKLSIEQVLKYAYINILEQQYSNSSKQYFLLFMGKGDFENQWVEIFPTIDSMREALPSVRLSELPKTWARKLKGLDEEILETANNTEFGFMNYDAFAASLYEYRSNIDLSSPYADTVSELFDGMLEELIERGLAARN